MARSEPPSSLEALRSAASPHEQLAALKKLKNDIIGHEQRKETIVRHGVVQHLVRALGGGRKSTGKRRNARQDLNGVAVGGTEEGPISEWDLDDQICLQGVFIVTSLAHAGSPFIAPLVAGGILQPLLSFLTPGTVPSRLTVETLRAIVVIVQALNHDPLREYSAVQESVASQIFSQPTTDNLAFILAQEESSHSVNEQLSLVMQIIRYFTDQNSKHQKALVTAGILDLLASRLAALICQGNSSFHPYALEIVAYWPPAPPQSCYCDLLEAIAAIVRGSAYLSARFFYSRDIFAIFPTVPHFPLVSDPYTSFSESLSQTGVFGNPLDHLLPQLSSAQSKPDLVSTLRGWPALGSFGPPDGSQGPSANDSQISASQHLKQPSDDLKSDLVAWLIYMIRSSTREERLSTIWLLSVLLNATDLNVQCERQLSLLVIPLLVQMIDDAQPTSSVHQSGEGVWAVMVRMRAPLALSLLVKGSASLQKAAIDADAIKSLCPILKRSFDPLTSTKKTMWSPSPPSPTPETRSLSDPCMLGPPILAPPLLVALYCRAFTMRAIAALAEKEDHPRKEIIKSGIVQCLVDALTPYPECPLPNTFVKSTDSIDPREGNPDFVLSAALVVITTLSRSISILRTSLIDGGIAKPVFNLLRHNNIEVKRAATDSMVNLILHFCPMRDELMGAGVLEVLCEHARSSDVELRVSALWALKHLITQSSNEVKIKAYETLGTNFLAQTLVNESNTGSHKTHLATPNALGEKVSLLNNMDEPAMDVDSPIASSDDESGDIISAQRRTIRQQYSQTEDHAARLRPIRNAEQSPAIRARRDDVKIQHHTLDFLRNIIAEPTPQQPELVDHLISTMGTPFFFEMIVAKLKPRSGSHGHEGPGSTAGKRPTLTTPGGSTGNAATQSYIDQGNYQHPDVIKSAVYTLVHVANGRPAHRHLVLSQPQLLAMILPHFAHPIKDIRTACVWLVHNILWVEDDNDAAAARQRALELRVSGIEDKCRHAVRDVETDIRERAKGVVEAFGKLLDSTGGTSGSGRVWDR